MQYLKSTKAATQAATQAVFDWWTGGDKQVLDKDWLSNPRISSDEGDFKIEKLQHVTSFQGQHVFAINRNYYIRIMSRSGSSDLDIAREVQLSAILGTNSICDIVPIEGDDRPNYYPFNEVVAGGKMDNNVDIAYVFEEALMDRVESPNHWAMQELFSKKRKKALYVIIEVFRNPIGTYFPSLLQYLDIRTTPFSARQLKVINFQLIMNLYMLQTNFGFVHGDIREQNITACVITNNDNISELRYEISDYVYSVPVQPGDLLLGLSGFYAARIVFSPNDKVFNQQNKNMYMEETFDYDRMLNNVANNNYASDVYALGLVLCSLNAYRRYKTFDYNPNEVFEEQLEPSILTYATPTDVAIDVPQGGALAGKPLMKKLVIRGGMLRLQLKHLNDKYLFGNRPMWQNFELKNNLYNGLGKVYQQSMGTLGMLMLHHLIAFDPNIRMSTRTTFKWGLFHSIHASYFNDFVLNPLNPETPTTLVGEFKHGPPGEYLTQVDIDNFENRVKKWNVSFTSKQTTTMSTDQYFKKLPQSVPQLKEQKLSKRKVTFPDQVKDVPPPEKDKKERYIPERKNEPKPDDLFSDDYSNPSGEDPSLDPTNPFSDNYGDIVITYDNDSTEEDTDVILDTIRSRLADFRKNNSWLYPYLRDNRTMIAKNDAIFNDISNWQNSIASVDISSIRDISDISTDKPYTPYVEGPTVSFKTITRNWTFVDWVHALLTGNVKRRLPNEFPKNDVDNTIDMDEVLYVLEPLLVHIGIQDKGGAIRLRWTTDKADRSGIYVNLEFPLVDSTRLRNYYNVYNNLLTIIGIIMTPTQHVGPNGEARDTVLSRPYSIIVDGKKTVTSQPITITKRKLSKEQLSQIDLAVMDILSFNMDTGLYTRSHKPLKLKYTPIATHADGKLKQHINTQWTSMSLQWADVLLRLGLGPNSNKEDIVHPEAIPYVMDAMENGCTDELLKTCQSILN